jgi:putative membrane protein
MLSRSQTTPTRGARIIIVALSALALALSSATSVRAQEKEKAAADAEFLTKVVPDIAASVKIIDYAVKNGSDEKVREFAERVLKQHKESVKTASEHAKRLNIAVDTNGDKDSKEMIDKLSKLKGSDLDVAFLEWLSHIHHDTTVFDNEVKNGSDAELKTYAKNSITAGNEHLKEARELLAELKK